ncbi:MAG: hypothetical protein ABSH00_03105 [Bryobacteraceae bacterium]|jgi:hypothetical protein
MTICIAAICDAGKRVVIAADRMFTAGPPLNVEFEPPLSKIQPVGCNCLVLAAGNSIFADEVVTRTKGSISATVTANILNVAHAAKEAYAVFREEKIEETIIGSAFGADLRRFRSTGGTFPNYLSSHAGFYQQVVIQSNNYNLGLELIVAGVDVAGAHIFYLSHPGSLFCFDKLGYSSIGSGGQHAALRFSLGRYTPGRTLSEALFAVYSAKRASEVAPGVGRDTEMAVVSAASTWNCSEGLLAELAAVHDGQVQETQPNLDRVKEAYANGQPKVG